MGGLEPLLTALALTRSAHQRILVFIVLLPRHRYRPAGGEFAVEFQRVIEHLHGEGFCFAIEFEAGRYSP